MKDKTLSLILLSYYSGERLICVYDSVSILFKKENIPFEMIIMDDGSQDNSYEVACQLEEKYDNIHAYQLSRNYGAVYSEFAGYSICSGACAISMPDDEQQPYQTIVDMYRLWEQGNKVILPYRVKRDDPIVSKFLANTYYKFMNKIADITYPPGGVDVAMLDREVIDVLNRTVHPRNTMLVAEVINLGFSPYYYAYERPLGLNEGSSRWTFRKKWKLAMDSIFAVSTLPVKIISWLGWISCTISVLAFIFYFYLAAFGNREFWGIVIPGWVSIILLLLLFGGLILLALGIVAEYMWRIYDEVKGRPGYIIKKKEQ